MEASFKTAVHRFGVSQGLVQDHPPNVTVVEGADVPGGRQHRGSMYIYIEVLGGLPDPAYTMQHLAEIIRDEYYQASGSVTGGLGQALRAANDWLFEENLNSPREQRGVAGVSCAVLRDGDLYVGQIGPALAYLAQAEGLRRFPEDSPWLRQAIPSDAERAASPPLGVRRVIEPLFYHATPDGGDVLVLASPALARLASSQGIAEAIGTGGEAARRRLQSLASGEELGAVIVTLAGVAAAPAPPEAEGEEEPAAAVPHRAPAAHEEARPFSPLPPRAAPQAPHVRQAAAAAGAGLLGALRRTLPPPQTPVARRPLRPAGQAGRGLDTRRLAVVLAVLLPVLVIVVVLGTRFQYEYSQRQRADGFLRQANEAHAAALANGDRGAQLEGLRQTLGLVDQALQVIPDQPQALALRQQATRELDAAANVHRLYTLWPLGELPAGPTGQARATRLLVRGSDLYILDRGAGRVYRRVLNPTGDALEPATGNPVLIQQGQSQGTAVVGELLDMQWMPAGGARANAGLVALDRNGSVFELDAAGAVGALPVADSAAWRKPVAAGAYGGNLYLLDAQAGRILKYVPAAGGYTNPPVDYLAAPAPDLSGAIDMGIDGRIYVLMADGKVLKFMLGKQQPFDITGLDQPLANPVAMFVTGEDEAQGSIYIADAGLARVVQLNKKGEFLGQYKAGEGAGDLAQLSGLFVDEAQQRIYLASGARLYAAPMNQGS